MEFLLLGALALIFGATVVNSDDDDMARAAPEPDGEDEDAAPSTDETEDRNLILGTDGDDTLAAGQNDLLRAGRGNDLLGGTDNAIISAGPGDDTIAATDTVTADGGFGNDIITAGGDATVTGGAGDDQLALGNNARGSGGDGNDTLAGANFSTVFGEDGEDVLNLRGAAVGFGGLGDDLITAAGRSEANGGGGNDAIIAEGNATARGGAGDDQIIGQDNARLFGGRGDDVVVGFGAASVDGGTGDDLIGFELPNETSSTSHVLTGGAGTDVFGLSLYQTDADQTAQIAPITITDFDAATEILLLETPPPASTTITLNADQSETEVRLTFDTLPDVTITLQNAPDFSEENLTFVPLSSDPTIAMQTMGTPGDDTLVGDQGADIAPGAGDDDIALYMAPGDADPAALSTVDLTDPDDTLTLYLDGRADGTYHLREVTTRETVQSDSNAEVIEARSTLEIAFIPTASGVSAPSDAQFLGTDPVDGLERLAVIDLGTETLTENLNVTVDDPGRFTTAGTVNDMPSVKVFGPLASQGAIQRA
ncbi:hypothetical protein SAMN05421666_2435 [Roseovarius nanhaiticus]|uniref:Hemolysin-type calcium-binding repeat-containing protein n=1 Tax=Roseovarius nanhaiticus TaxID=573024 RepID=A0A1N7H3F4_9RHOB|nr:calcium-binding protein [Roseovarius nanhaiticus]SEL14505.1 hypothetical protein SAMN05216208_2884 [Roseovarius nanhaiticus]SIS19377.1 hypothetical protein SAMN05421666_2435 [Roseovarius nanhaiticus]